MTEPAAVRRGPNRVVLRVLVPLTALAVAACLMVSATRSEAAPSDPITKSNLSWEADREWQEPADWKAAELPLHPMYRSMPQVADRLVG